MMVETKICKECQFPVAIESFKPRTYFRERGRSYTSRDARCNPCRAAHEKKLRDNKAPRHRTIKGAGLHPHAHLDPATKAFLY